METKRKRPNEEKIQRLEFEFQSLCFLLVKTFSFRLHVAQTYLSLRMDITPATTRSVSFRRENLRNA